MAAPQTDDSRAAHPLHFDGQVLDSMYSEIAQAREVFRPSRFWDELGNQGVEQLTGHGLNNFKRTVNLRYFNWGIFGILAHQFLPMLRKENEHSEKTNVGFVRHRIGLVRLRLFRPYVIQIYWDIDPEGSRKKSGACVSYCA